MHPHALRSINQTLEIKRERARHLGARRKGLLKEGLQLWHDYTTITADWRRLKSASVSSGRRWRGI